MARPRKNHFIVDDMGQVFPCGCRVSGEGYYPCPYHESMILADLQKLEEDEKYLRFVINKNQDIWRARNIFEGNKRIKRRMRGGKRG